MLEVKGQLFLTLNEHVHQVVSSNVLAESKLAETPILGLIDQR